MANSQFTLPPSRPTFTGLPACNKDDNTSSGDYTELFKNTIWTGEYKDSTCLSKPYSILIIAAGGSTRLCQ
ncbi:hypothetical protein D3H65_28065 [Paraflavitalea soli]|uniref:Uncharacterized protein n=1 Tax=Paraflavitalea soli TaxID=2315862 RepID=A0A3B7MVZ8_9BACT|nr:hypothetical protein D3H65_28065 [Paraflavitalea soli]